MNLRSWLLFIWLCSGFFGVVVARAESSPAAITTQAEGCVYNNDRQPAVPWSIHVLRVPRRPNSYLLHAVHAGTDLLNLGTVGQLVLDLSPILGVPVAALNGDFYERQGRYTGRPRGLQISGGELLSAPAGGASFWLDASGEPHATNTQSLLEVTWPNGVSAAIGLNEERRANQIVLYTPALGPSTRTRSGRELVLEKEGLPWLPLHAGRIHHAKVREVRTGGDTLLAADSVVLSIGPAMLGSVPSVAVGTELQISTATSPALRGVKEAISGGPVLVREGKSQRIRGAESDSYQAASAFERHPRSAIGWNEQWFFLVAVDGRQKRLSVGMTLSELAAYLVKLGCTDAMNLDGGGSTTLWFGGKVCNRPCDGHERPVANALVVVKKPTKTSEGHSPQINPATR